MVPANAGNFNHDPVYPVFGIFGTAIAGGPGRDIHADPATVKRVRLFVSRCGYCNCGRSARVNPGKHFLPRFSLANPANLTKNGLYVIINLLNIMPNVPGLEAVEVT